MPNKTSKLIDVARLAGVSTATVSRVLSHPQRVGPNTRQRVQSAIHELAYVPHGAARALRSRRTRTIGAVVPTLSNAIFAEYTQALQKSLAGHGYRLLLSCNEYDPLSEVEIVEPLIEHGIDGLVLVGHDHSSQLYEKLIEYNLPYVLTWSVDEPARHPSIGFSNRDAAGRVVDYLLDMGHRNLAMIAGIQAGNDRARLRVDGVQLALRKRGLKLPSDCLMERPYTYAAGREAMLRMMSCDPRPTAVICGNDVLAIGALTECRARNISVPGTVSITGFDDMEVASITNPPLTTIRVPAEKLGRLAAEYIVNRAEGEEMALVTKLDVDLVVRGTTGPPGHG